MNGPALMIEGLVKRVGWWTPQILLDGLALEVAPGRIFGWLASMFHDLAISPTFPSEKKEHLS